MKIFNTYDKAMTSFANKEVKYLNSLCPYKNENKVCGNWCALFYYNNDKNDNTTPYVILGCKKTNMKLYIEDEI